jgi:hypothetical protein
MRGAWAGHLEALSDVRPGCPDAWAGDPEEDDGPTEEFGWQDHCETAGGVAYSGTLAWDRALAIDGDADTLLGATVSGSRFLRGAATVTDGDDLVFSFVGEADDAMYRTTSEDYEQWSYSSTVAGTTRGSAGHPSSAPIPGGFRADLHLFYQGGEVSSFEARGEIFLLDGRIGDRFDSVSIDMALDGPGALGPDDCALEPRGWISLRDADAYWYDLIFQPRYEDDLTDKEYANLPYGECDGCGTLFVRGVEIGEVCIDFEWLWTGSLVPPEPIDYVLSTREGMQGAP